MPANVSTRQKSASVPSPPPLDRISGAQLAMAFDGELEPLRTTMGYRLAAAPVFLVMLLLPLVYLGMIAAAAMGVYWYAVNTTGMFSAVTPGRATLAIGVAYITPILAGSIMVIFMILPIFWRARKRERTMWVDRKEQPLLFAYVDKLCDTMSVPRPLRIDLTATANASAHIDNGLLGLINRKLVLTIGLPLVGAMDLKQLTGVIAHELGHFAQGGTMRASYAATRINYWFFRLAYTRSGVDEAINSVLAQQAHWSISLVAGTCKLALWLTRLLLKLMALISHALTMILSRQAEFDADHQSARIVGSEPIGEALQLLPFIDTANKLAVSRAQAAWVKKSLPDDLVVMTHFYNDTLPEKLKDAITAQILAHDTSWFDTHPPLFQRVGTLKKANLKGVLKLNAPATCLFRDFEELSKLTTIKLYQTVLGNKLQAEHLVPADVALAVVNS